VAVAGDGDEVPTLVLDAGTGLRRVTPLLGGAPFRGTILLTHLHWDHVHGLPFFAGGDRADARTAVLLPGQGPGCDAAAVLARGMSPPHFPIGPDRLRGQWSFGSLDPGEGRAEGLTITTREIPHKGGRTFGYRVSDGRASIAYLPDHCPTACGPGPDGWGEYHPAAMELAEGADLLVHDAQLMPDELAAEAAFGHAAADYALELGRRAGARRVVLFHHRPDRTDRQLDGLARRLTGRDMDVNIAAEDLVIDL
jgi:phosphoribosyl 1,2-cyclic phosphodiesterase